MNALLTRRPPARRARRGVTVVVVLVLMTVMLLGGLALARMTETGTLVFGNVAAKDGSLQASELGLNDAFQRINAPGFDQGTDQGGWYFASMRPVDANGVPNLNFDGGRKIEAVSGRYSVSYMVERMCNAAVVVDMLQQCLVRLKDPPATNASADAPKIDPPNMRQYRITVRVTDAKGTSTWVQALSTVNQN